jgi:hypothetical protein
MERAKSKWKILVGNFEGKMPIWGCRRRSEDNIKTENDEVDMNSLRLSFQNVGERLSDRKGFCVQLMEAK